MKRLTTTSYAILGLLGICEWTSYELTRQMRRGLRHFWPRAESNVYEAPKNLVEHGLATATRHHVGKRPRTTYAITRDGRRALREWLDEPGSAPVIEFEGLVKVFFAEQGTRAQLLATLASIRCEAEQTRSAHAEVAAEVAETGGPFPQRIHVSALVFKFLAEQSEAVLRWTRWAEEQVESWPDGLDVAQVPDGPALFRQVARELAQSGSRATRAA
jgi:DNA-binding PadR family transcriptional regulator